MVLFLREAERVCVTGAGGYVASWLVNLLLSKGYMVHGTVRDPCDAKNSHLKKLENSGENLQLFKTDLLDYEGLCAAVAGCTGVFHVACPVPLSKMSNPQVEMIEPAIIGTRNVLNACLKAKVKRVVVVSSVGAVMVNPNWPKDKVMDEECWSDVEFCKAIENYYWVAKTMAESEALEFGKRSELDIITICPSVVIGPRLQPTINTSSLVLLALLTDGVEEVEDVAHPLVDVRDVAEALLLVYEKPEAKGRYICTSYTKRMRALAEKLRSMYPNYSCNRKFIDVARDANPITSDKLQNLGWECRTLEETIVDSVKDFEESGVIEIMTEVGEQESVCVTGAGGYVASWLVKFLLSKSYTVHGTVRDPCDAKNDHLKKLDYASENLQLFKADLLDYDGLCEAVAGCAGVFHVACPVADDKGPDPEVQMIEPSVTGTRNVLNACSKAKVKKIVVVSSIGAVSPNPNWPKDQVMDEECWSDLEYCKANKLWYRLGKTLAEMEAIEYAKKSTLNIVTVCPSLVLGPMLQSTMNATSLFFLKFLKGRIEPEKVASCPLVDVRDVAEALSLVFENPKAEGRYICSSHSITTQELLDKLKSICPDNINPRSTIKTERRQTKVSSEKLQKLGWKYRPLENTIVDAVSNYEERGDFGED